VLELADISDARAYEREREAFRSEVIALKKLRRVAVGPLVTVVFENRTTVRFQVQEMARAERMTTDAQIQGELDIYNPLIPSSGELSMTLFIELTSEEQLREWLPKLVGIERSVGLRLTDAEAGGSIVVPATVDESHESQLTREEVTAAVHYVRISLDSRQASRLAAGPAAVVVDLPEYHHEAVLSDETRASIAGDW
jgi:hypothetical protein